MLKHISRTLLPQQQRYTSHPHTVFHFFHKTHISPDPSLFPHLSKYCSDKTLIYPSSLECIPWTPRRVSWDTLNFEMSSGKKKEGVWGKCAFCWENAGGKKYSWQQRIESGVRERTHAKYTSCPNHSVRQRTLAGICVRRVSESWYCCKVPQLLGNGFDFLAVFVCFSCWPFFRV